MPDINIIKIAKELSVKVEQVAATIELLDKGATMPFIARYRKEVTGSLDEVQIGNIRDRIEQLRDLDNRKVAILKSIDDQGKLTDDLKRIINSAESMSMLEDIYLPYKPKRKTRASMAREKGLAPLADKIMEQGSFDVQVEAAKYINEENVESEVVALQGARDIMAETINEDQEARQLVRDIFIKKSTISTKVIKGKEVDGQKYKDYFEWEEKLSKAPSHRVLAMRRGEKEMFLSLNIGPDGDEVTEALEAQFVKNRNEAGEQVKIAAHDSYKRLLKPSMETEMRIDSKTSADIEAIRIFSENLNKLLLASPLGQKRVLAIDPGFRSGCKVVCLDEQGQLLHNETIFPHEPQKQVMKASATIEHLCEKFKIEAVAIGNGTASRESEVFIKGTGIAKSITVVMVNESGASIYSASEVAREEFPDHDLTVRGSVSIGRRLMDPLAELVKIDAKSIGVGQYQHDVDQPLLKKGLQDVVERCVNLVGVEVNTASAELLSFVSGLGPQLAKSIVNHRNTNGAFDSRESLKKVARFGNKAFEQAAGFLRIRNASNPLDSSSVHPESYHVVNAMANDLNCTVQDIIGQSSVRNNISLQKYVTESIGLPTLNDIIGELAKPGRDPREKFEAFSFTEGVESLEDVKVGMKLAGVVTNVTNFGAFVDIGVHQDGLVHISQLADKYVSNPADVVSVQDKVQVIVTEVDVARKRIALSMKLGEEDSNARKPKKAPVAKKKQQRKNEPEGDFQTKLAMLKGKFGN